MEQNNNRINPYGHVPASRTIATMPRHASPPNRALTTFTLTQQHSDMDPPSLPPPESAAQQVARGMATFGKADSTNRATASALNTFDDWYRTSFGAPYTSITEQTIENNFLQLLLLKYACYLGRNKIPSKKGGYLTIKVLTNYFGKAKDFLRGRFPSHPAWNGHDNGGWYTTLYKSLEKDAARVMSDEAVRSGTMPLYRQSCSEFYHVDRRALLEPGYDSDLIGVCRSLMSECFVGRDFRSEKCMQHRFWIVTDYLAAGRGGEIKFLRWDDARWDTFLESPVLVWSEVKTLTEHLMMFVPDASGFEFDWLHALGSFACLEQGLFRSPTIDGNIKHFVFPDLHEFKGDTVTRNLTKVLRKYVNPQVLEFISSRSLREACGTVLAMHPDISDAEMRARGGWATADNSKYYHNDCPSTNLPGAAALAGHHDCHRRFYWPSFATIPWEWKQNLSLFVETLLPTNLKYFEKDGQLFPLRVAAAASLVMYFESTMQKFGGMHALNKRLTEVAGASRITDHTGNCDGMDVLKTWSSHIKKDFETRNATHSARNIHETLRLQVEENTMLRHEVANVSASLAAMAGSLDKVQTAIAEIFTSSNLGKRRHVTPDGTCALPVDFQVRREQKLGSGYDCVDFPRSGEDLSPADSPMAVNTHRSDARNSTKKSSSLSDGYLKRPPESDIVDVTWSPPKKTRAVQTAFHSTRTLQSSALYQTTLLKSATSSANVSIKFLLDEFYAKYIRGRAFTNASPSIFPSHVAQMIKYCPGLSNSKKEVTRCMELVAGTVNRRLFDEYFQECTSARASSEMEDRAMAWVLEVEEKNGLRTIDIQKKCKAKPYVVGVGKRLLKIQSELRSPYIPFPTSVELWEPRII